MTKRLYVPDRVIEERRAAKIANNSEAESQKKKDLLNPATFALTSRGSFFLVFLFLATFLSFVPTCVGSSGLFQSILFFLVNFSRASPPVATFNFSYGHVSSSFLVESYA